MNSTVSPLAPKPATTEDSKKHLKLLIAIVLIALLLIIGLLFLLWRNSQNTASNLPSTGTSDTPVSYSNNLTISTPAENATVSGQIQVSGTAPSNTSDVKVDLFDANNNLLAENFVTDFAQTQQYPAPNFVTWTTTLDVYSSPEASTGKIVASVNQTTNTLKASTDVTFAQKTTADRLEVTAPLENQLLSGQDLLFDGQMQGFFEGTLNVRFKDEAGNIIYTDVIQSTGDNTSAFSPYSKIVSFPSTISSSVKTITVEYYEISAKDGSENVLLTYTIRH